MTVVGDILELSYGKALKQSDRDGGDVPVVGSGGVVGGHSRGITDGPTIVVGRKGSIGSVTWIDGPAWPIDTAYFVRPKRDDLDRRWAYWMLRSLRMETMNKSAAVPGLNRDDVYRLDVYLPPPDDQRRIATILDQAGAIRTKRRQILTHLDTLTQSIFHDMFGDPIRNDRGLPIKEIGSLAPVVTGNSPSRADSANFGTSIEWIKSDNLGGDVASTATEWLSERGRSRARIAPSGSILVTCIAGSPASIGKASRVDREVAFNQQINAVHPSDSINGAFLLAQLKTAPDLVRAKSTGGMKGLVSKSSFSSIEVLVPNRVEQGEFAARVQQVNAQRAVVATALTADDQLFASLQSRAFRGDA